MNAVRRLLCALGFRHFCAPRDGRGNPEAERVRQRQREILVRAESLGVRVDVVTTRRNRDVGNRQPR